MKLGPRGDKLPSFGQRAAQLFAQGFRIEEVARRAGISRATAYRWTQRGTFQVMLSEARRKDLDLTAVYFQEWLARELERG